MKKLFFMMTILCVVATTTVFSSVTDIHASSFDIEDLHDDGSITISTDIPDVFIEQHSSGKTGNVKLVGKDWNRFNVSVGQLDGHVSIQVELKEEQQSNQTKQIHAELHIVLPKDFQQGSLYVDTYAGDCKITSAIACSDLGLSTYSGTIGTLVIDVSEQAVLTTYSGSITGRALSARTITLSTASGNIKFNRLDVGRNGTFEAQSMSGNVEINDMVAYHVKIDSISGCVKCNIPKHFNGPVVARTVAGKIQNNYQNLPEATIQTVHEDQNTSNDFLYISTITGAITITK